MDILKILSGTITPTSAVIIAFITTCGALLVKRHFSLADRRTQHEEQCERWENGYRILSFWARQHWQNILSLDTLREDPNYGTTYALMRLREMASEETPLEKLDAYVEGRADLPGGE